MPHLVPSSVKAIQFNYGIVSYQTITGNKTGKINSLNILNLGCDSVVEFELYSVDSRKGRSFLNEKSTRLEL